MSCPSQHSKFWTRIIYRIHLEAQPYQLASQLMYHQYCHLLQYGA
jgi:hypothetical protein